MKLHRTISLLALVLGTMLVSAARAQVSFQVFSGPGPYCPTSHDEPLGEVALRAITDGAVSSGSSFSVNLPAPLSATAAPALLTSPAVANVSLTVSGQSLIISFSAGVNLRAGTTFQTMGTRLDAAKISGNQAVVTFSAPSGSPFSFTNGSAGIGTADPSVCPPVLALSADSLSLRALTKGPVTCQKVLLTGVSGRAFAAPALAVTTDDSGNWLTAMANGSDSRYEIAVTANPANLAPGTYTGKVSLTVTDAANSPQVVKVKLLVLEPAPQISPTVLIFHTVAGADPPTQQFTVRGAGHFTISTLVETPAAGKWLTFTEAAGKDPVTNQDIVTVTVAPKAAGLPPSGPTPYIGFVLASSELSARPDGVTVQLHVVQAPQITLDRPQLSFRVDAGSGTAVSQTLLIRNSGGGALTWTARTATDRGGNWLSLNPGSGTGEAVVTVTVNPTGLAPGVYTGNVEVAATGAPNSPQRIPVTLLVGTVPAIADGGIKNGASFSDGTAAAGTILSIFGSNLASSTLTAQTLPLPTTLGGVQVKVNGTPAPLFYVSPGQINFQLPPEVAGTSVSIVVSREGVDGLATSVPLVAALPGLFSISSDGKGPGAILKADFSVVSSTNPVARGSVVLLYGAGMGAVNPPVASGQPAPSDILSRMVLTPRVTIGGLEVRVLFAGLAPGFAGLYQLNVEVPIGATSGPAVSVVVSVNGVESNTVTLAVQ